MNPLPFVLIWISGPPGAGKSSLSEELVKSFERALIVPIDDIREWVKSGAAGPVPWTDETERQYRLGEEAGCAIAARYVQAGFTAIIDACRGPLRVDEVLRECAPGIPWLRILLRPSLEENYQRAHSRTNKEFDPHFLDGVIEHTHRRYGEEVPDDWLVIDNTCLSVEQEIQLVLERALIFSHNVSQN